MCVIIFFQRFVTTLGGSKVEVSAIAGLGRVTHLRCISPSTCCGQEFINYSGTRDQCDIHPGNHSLLSLGFIQVQIYRAVRKGGETAGCAGCRLHEPEFKSAPADT